MPLILLNMPFALVVGGVAALWPRGLNLNLSGSIGFITLFGVAVLNGIVLVSSIYRLGMQGMPIEESVLEGAVLRLRQVLMTALVASLGFLPMALGRAEKCKGRWSPWVSGGPVWVAVLEGAGLGLGQVVSAEWVAGLGFVPRALGRAEKGRGRWSPW